MNAPLAKPRIAIIGGGITGLACAFYAEQAGLTNLHLYESASQLGGKLKTAHQDDMTLELGAESFLARKPAGIELCKQLGIVDQLQSTRIENQGAFVFWQNQLHPMPKGLSGFVPTDFKQLNNTKLLSWLGKWRARMEPLMPIGPDTDESLTRFMNRRFGKQMVQRLIAPLLGGIYSADGSRISLAATYPHLKQLEQTHGSLVKGLNAMPNSEHAFPTAFASFKQGMQAWPEAIADALQHTRIHLNTPIQQITKSSQTFKLTFNQTIGPADHVVLTTPAFVSAHLLNDTAPELSAELKRIEHASTAVANVWFHRADIQHPIKGYGFVIPESLQRDVTAVTWTSSKHAHRAPDNHVLLRVYLGRAGSTLDIHQPDISLNTIVQRELKRTMGISQTPKGITIQRWPNGTAQYELGHLDRLKRIDALLNDIPGLSLCGASYRGIGIPDCIQQAKRAMAMMP